MSGIFISYRREDTAGYAGRLYDALTLEFDKKSVFIDVDSIRGGEDFVNAINQRIASSSVVIVLIGKGWLNSGGANSRRLDDPQDFVRLEVATALSQKISVVPVLVGGATMPNAQDLPAPLAALAHINAVQIFDPLFHDSVRHLIDEIRPFVPPRSLLAGFNRTRLGALAILALILLGSLGIAIWAHSHASPSSQASKTRYVAPDPSETLDGPGEPAAPRIKVTTPPDITVLPPAVEASKNVVMPGSSLRVTGPSRPRILWRANVTVGDAWSVEGVASDGTVYLYDSENKVVDAIRDGKEIWAHSSSSSPLGFDPEGRLWLEDSSSNSFTFNSRGEGGRVMKKSLLPDRSRLQLTASSQIGSSFCREGKVSMYAPQKHPWSHDLAWSVELDGNCNSQEVVVAPRTGDIYVTSDAGTLYAIAPNGHLLWTVKQACKDTGYKVYPGWNDDVIVACPRQPLYAIRAGKPLWTETMGASGNWTWGDSLFDAAGNSYFGGEGPPLSGYLNANHLIAVDKTGKQLWTILDGTQDTPQPVGFDVHGRLYVKIQGERLVALSQ